MLFCTCRLLSAISCHPWRKSSIFLKFYLVINDSMHIYLSKKLWLKNQNSHQKKHETLSGWRLDCFISNNKCYLVITGNVLTKKIEWYTIFYIISFLKNIQGAQSFKVFGKFRNIGLHLIELFGWPTFSQQHLDGKSFEKSITLSVSWNFSCSFCSI